MNDPAKELLHAIHLKNLTAKYRDINLRNIRQAAIPLAGFFWIDVDGDTLYGKSVPFNQGERIFPDTPEEHLVHPDDGHYEAWSEIKKLRPGWELREYEDIPRGRVVFKLSPNVKKCEFRIYMCPLLASAHCESMVCREYLLPSGYYRFFYDDEHYFLSNGG